MGRQVEGGKTWSFSPQNQIEGMRVCAPKRSAASDRLEAGILQSDAATPPAKLTKPLTLGTFSVPSASVFQPPKLCPATMIREPSMPGCRTM